MKKVYTVVYFIPFIGKSSVETFENESDFHHFVYFLRSYNKQYCDIVAMFEITYDEEETNKVVSCKELT